MLFSWPDLNYLVDFVISMRWTDPRLTFQNLKDRHHCADYYNYLVMTVFSIFLTNYTSVDSVYGENVSFYES
jgi:hypothetical protein